MTEVAGSDTTIVEEYFTIDVNMEFSMPENCSLELRRVGQHNYRLTLSATDQSEEKTRELIANLRDVVVARLTRGQQ
jgi:hypothetical protein